MTTLDGRASHLALLPPGIIMCRGCMLLLSRHEWLGSPCLDFRLMAATTGTTMMKTGSTPNDQSGGPLEMMLGLKLVWCGWYVSLCGGLRCSMFTANLVSPLEPQGWGSVQEHRSGPDSWLHLLCSVSHNYDVTFKSAQVMMCHNVVRVVLVHLNHGTGKSSSASRFRLLRQQRRRLLHRYQSRWCRRRRRSRRCHQGHRRIVFLGLPRAIILVMLKDHCFECAWLKPWERLLFSRCLSPRLQTSPRHQYLMLTFLVV